MKGKPNIKRDIGDGTGTFETHQKDTTEHQKRTKRTKLNIESEQRGRDQTPRIEGAHYVSCSNPAVSFQTSLRFFWH